MKSFFDLFKIIGLLWLIGYAHSMAYANPVGPVVFGYVGSWVPESLSVQSLNGLSRIKFMELKINKDGTLKNEAEWPRQWRSLRAHAKEMGIPIDVVVTLFSPVDFDRLFLSPSTIKKLEKNILKELEDASISGIHLDVEIFEPVSPQATENYRSFVVSLTKQIQTITPQKLISVFFGFEADKHLYDSASLKNIDHVVIQGYDAHWRDGTQAGPVAPLMGDDRLTWQKMYQTVRQLGVHPQRILMGFPTYGYEWRVKPCHIRGRTLGAGQTTVFGRFTPPLAPSFEISIQDRVQAYGLRYESSSGSAYYQGPLQADGSCQVGWFEDWWTLHKKLDWLAQEHIAGLAIFALGYDQSELLRSALDRFKR